MREGDCSPWREEARRATPILILIRIHARPNLSRAKPRPAWSEDDDQTRRRKTMKTKEDSNDPDRQLGEPFTCRYWQDNQEQIMEISRKAGRSAREVARDLMDDALRRHLSGAESTVGNNDEVVKKIDLLIEQKRQMDERYEQLAEQSENLGAGLIQNLREFYAILLETLSAAIGARRITWNFVAHTVLKHSRLSDEQINERYRAEKKAWIEEKDRIAKLLEEGIKKMPPQQ